MNKEIQERLTYLEQKHIKQQAELVENRIARQKLENRIRQFNSEVIDLQDKLKTQLTYKSTLQRELDLIRRERACLIDQINEIKLVFDNVMNDGINSSSGSSSFGM